MPEVRDGLHQTKNAPSARRSRSAEAYATVRTMITDGRLRAGQMITESWVATRLEMSRTPVREAFKALISDGLLVASATGTCIVFPHSVRDVADVYTARAFLEGQAARLFVLRGDARALHEVRTAAHDCRDAVEAGELTSARERNRMFHVSLLNGSGNQRIIDMVDRLTPILLRYSRMLSSFTDNATHSAQEHVEIVEVLAAAEIDRAERVTRRHVLRAGARTVQAMERIEGVGLDHEAPPARLLRRYG